MRMTRRALLAAAGLSATAAALGCSANQVADPADDATSAAAGPFLSADTLHAVEIKLDETAYQQAVEA